MAISQTIWSLDNKNELKESSLISEKELEDLLCEHIEILNNNWLVVNRQVKTDAGKFIDILCIDRDGDMVVVELKKDMTPREVTAQVIDYAASVAKMSVEEIAEQYILFTNGEETLDAAFKSKFGSALDDSIVNERVKMTIVATKMDSSTERIIHFLRDVYGVDINILFFSVYKSGEERIISRTWFVEDIEENIPSPVSQKRQWNGEYYVSFGDFDCRRWTDARKYGFISAGHGSWYSKTLFMLSKGDRVWVNIPQTGYVGVGIVEEEAKMAKDMAFTIDGSSKTMTEMQMDGDYSYMQDDEELAEYVVKINWIKTISEKSAVKETGFFGNQNTVCRPTTEKWNYTVSRLKTIWNID